jgi:hypothetical protein
MIMVRNETGRVVVFIFNFAFLQAGFTAEKTKPARSSSGFQKIGDDLFVQKSRRQPVKCHATRFSAATVIGLVGFTNISTEVAPITFPGQ